MHIKTQKAVYSEGKFTLLIFFHIFRNVETLLKCIRKKIEFK